MKAIVYANKGYKSQPMPIEKALSYAYMLRSLGNYNLEVIAVRSST